MLGQGLLFLAKLNLSPKTKQALFFFRAGMEDKSELEEATFKGLIMPNGPAKK